MVQAGRGSTLLIHEATFEPCLEDQARQKRHSTTAEALEVAEVGCSVGTGGTSATCAGKSKGVRLSSPMHPIARLQRMGAYRCILTHFSQRYPKWPEGVAQPGEGSASSRAAVAFDGMRVPFALLPVLPALMPAVRAALADAEEDGQPDEEAAAEAGAEEPVS